MVHKIEKNISLYRWSVKGLEYEKYKTFIEMQKKVCSSCLKEKPIQEMSRNKNKNAYYTKICKLCTNKHQRKKYFIEKNIRRKKHKEYVQKNPDKQKKWCKTRYLKDPQKYKANSKIYNRFRRNQTIALSQNIKNQIKIIYRKRIFMGTKYHVDHIIPLRGKNVSGLHVPWNLQIITAKENLSKNNKF